MSLQIRLLYFVIFIGYSCSVFGQAKSVSNPLIDNLNNRSKILPQEKVHLHFDRSFYASGDTIRFASYLVNASKNIPSDLSHILYVEFIGKNTKVIKSSSHQLIAGFGSGNFALPDTLSAGVYQVRAYTNWMRNFDPEFYFSKEIYVINPFTKYGKGEYGITAVENKSITNASSQNYEVSFYPEGGQLVNGLNSKVGFKMVASNGKGVVGTGSVVDDTGKHILRFATGHGGLGAFNFLPQKGKSYTAIINFADGSKQTIMIPKAQQSGYVIDADNSNSDTLFVKLQASEDLLGKEKMNFIPISNGSPLFYMETTFPNQQINVSIPKDRIPGGIIQLSLLNAHNQPISERLIFNQYTDEVKLVINGLKPTYQKGEQIELELQATDRLGKPVVASLSMSVTTGNSPTDGDSENTIYSNLLLTSDLKGYIEQPNYYFSDRSEIRVKALDDLMLTHGWRRYSWKEIATNQIEQTLFTAENKLKISGRIQASSRNSSIKNIPVTLLAGELGSGMLIDTLTDSVGRFTFLLPDSMGYFSLRIQAKPKNGAKYIITLDEHPIPEILDISVDHTKRDLLEAFNISKEYSNYATHLKASREGDFTFSGTNKLKEVTIKDYNPKPKINNSHSANLNGPGKADVIILSETLDKMTDLTSLDLLLPGVRAIGTSGYRLNSSVGISNLPNILVLVDGVDGIFRDLREVSIRDIESIELLKNPAYTGIYGIRGAGGVILITTKKGGNSKTSTSSISTNTIIIDPVFSLKKETYTVRNDHYKELGIEQTIFWKPDLVTDKNGKLKILYPAAQNNQLIIIEGISLKGNLIHFNKYQ
ncbi:TonB-dependent receptor plug domain-containing protein [Pedobacter jejuensis]|uniref:TonB-dependent receptor plug domain-containing protein n=1 Tax=Pedobacter jejuensis TaxID=1268550 RepID=A0A3N0C040_9SPHI|nr:TonB-dependent receptor plug domain-containing protein [Pedobacter jejuensis]RNL55415.1 hypothetical protein D7004_04865 [Pedobacter jejuensis]